MATRKKKTLKERISSHFGYTIREYYEKYTTFKIGPRMRVVKFAELFNDSHALIKRYLIDTIDYEHFLYLKIINDLDPDKYILDAINDRLEYYANMLMGPCTAKKHSKKSRFECFRRNIGEAGCCGGCSGYFRNISTDEEADYLKKLKIKYKFNYKKRYGFWRPGKGCVLPRIQRSEVCLKYTCNGLNDALRKSGLLETYSGEYKKLIRIYVMVKHGLGQCT